MVEEGFSWIYLIFFLIPLARIIPRLVRKWKKGKSPLTENQFIPSDPRIEQRPESFERQESFERPESFERQESFERPESFEKPQNKEMQVLGELNKGVRDFNKIQKNLGINNQELENILKDLEDQGLMKIVKKGGLVGVKVELYATEEGFKKYYK